MSETLRRRVMLAVLLPFPLVVILGLTFLWQIHDLNERVAWVEHTQSVIGQVYQVQTLLIDQETGLRGFLYADNPVLLEPLTEGRQKLGPAVDNLAEFTQDNPNQQRNIGQLRSAYASWWERVSHDLSSHVEKLPGHSPQAIANILERKADMDRMRSILHAMIEEERHLLAQRREAADSAKHTTILAESISLPILGIFLVWFMRRLVRNIDQVYEKVISERDVSLGNERRARAAAEALAAEVAERSTEMERMFRQIRQERDDVRARLSRFEKAGG